MEFVTLSTLPGIIGRYLMMLKVTDILDIAIMVFVFYKALTLIQSTRAASLLKGVLVFLAVYGISPLDVANDAFCRGGYIEKDIQQHYAGWLFYRENAIEFPFCVTKAVNAPAGVSVAYTDSIPLLAALLRRSGGDSEV